LDIRNIAALDGLTTGATAASIIDVTDARAEGNRQLQIDGQQLFFPSQWFPVRSVGRSRAAEKAAE
jgi:hypothetical protein